MSRKLNVASALLFIVGIWGVLEGVMGFILARMVLGYVDYNDERRVASSNCFGD